MVITPITIVSLSIFTDFTGINFAAYCCSLYWEKRLITFCDAPEVWQMNLQDPATPISEGMIYFHNFLFSFIAVIGILVLWMLWRAVFTFDERVSKSYSLKFTHSSLLEIIWTILPAVALLMDKKFIILTLEVRIYHLIMRVL